MTKPFVAPVGVRIAGQFACAPSGVLTNTDLEQMLDTSDEWIRQRTGIERRHIIDRDAGESEFSLACDALRGAIADSDIDPSQIDLLIHASVSSEMTCPSNACRIATACGLTGPGAFDLVAACSGMVYAMNLADTMIRSGRMRTVAVVGCDALSKLVDYDDRSVSILFGDGAGAMVLTADDDPDRGCLYQTMGADGSGWQSLYMPRDERDIPEEDRDNPIKLGCLRMNGREVYRFAVNKFREVIEDALAATGLSADDIDHFVCHQSNIRIIEAAKERIGLPDHKVHVNIAEYGNTSAGSVGLVWNDLVRAGKVEAGQTVMFIAFGGGLTWGSSVWRV